MARTSRYSAGCRRVCPWPSRNSLACSSKGYIFQAFGNWIDTDQTLDLVIMPGAAATSSNPGGIGTLAAPRNLVLNWKANQSFSDAIKSTLSTAFPGSTVTVNVNSNIVRPNDEVAFFPTLEQFSQYVRQTSFDIVKTAGYAGVTIVPSAGAFNVFDGSQAQQGAQKQIAFEDLIGQPTWIEAPNISIKTVMRADLSVGDSISLPQTVTTNSQASLSSQVNQQVAFQGGFQIVSARHVGNFRQPSRTRGCRCSKARRFSRQPLNNRRLSSQTIVKKPLLPARSTFSRSARRAASSTSTARRCRHRWSRSSVLASSRSSSRSPPRRVVPYTLPNVTVPLFGPEYVRYPIQPGCKGVVFPADAYLGGVSGLGGGVADLALRGNLSTLVFFPIGNTSWSASDDANALVLYGPDGVIIRDMNKKTVFTLTENGIVITLQAGKFVTINGGLIVNGNLQISGNIELATGGTYAGDIKTTGNVIAGEGTADQVGLTTHIHPAPGGNTGPPTAGS